MTKAIITYEIHTRWIENNRLLAWDYVGSRNSKKEAIDCAKTLISLPRKVQGYDARVLMVVRVDGRTVRQKGIALTEQLELFPRQRPPKSKFVSGINYGAII